MTATAAGFAVGAVIALAGLVVGYCLAAKWGRW